MRVFCRWDEPVNRKLLVSVNSSYVTTVTNLCHRNLSIYFSHVCRSVEQCPIQAKLELFCFRLRLGLEWVLDHARLCPEPIQGGGGKAAATGKKKKQVSLPEDGVWKRVAIFNNSLPCIGTTYLTKGHLWWYLQSRWGMRSPTVFPSVAFTWHCIVWWTLISLDDHQLAGLIGCLVISSGTQAEAC